MISNYYYRAYDLRALCARTIFIKNCTNDTRSRVKYRRVSIEFPGFTLSGGRDINNKCDAYKNPVEQT